MHWPSDLSSGLWRGFDLDDGVSVALGLQRRWLLWPCRSFAEVLWSMTRSQAMSTMLSRWLSRRGR